MSREEEIYREVMLNQLSYLPTGYNWRAIAVVKSIESLTISITDQTLNDGSITFQLSPDLESQVQQLRPDMVIRIFGKKVESGHEIHHVEPLDLDIEKYYMLRALETRSSF